VLHPLFDLLVFLGLPEKLPGFCIFGVDRSFARPSTASQSYFFLLQSPPPPRKYCPFEWLRVVPSNFIRVVLPRTVRFFFEGPHDHSSPFLALCYSVVLLGWNDPSLIWTRFSQDFFLLSPQDAFRIERCLVPQVPFDDAFLLFLPSPLVSPPPRNPGQLSSPRHKRPVRTPPGASYLPPPLFFPSELYDRVVLPYPSLFASLPVTF